MTIAMDTMEHRMMGSIIMPPALTNSNTPDSPFVTAALYHIPLS
jgi:hypothetical protein